MAGTQKLVDLSLAQFGDRLSERTPTPGGGSVAAHLVALGAALSAMAFRFTSGEKFAPVEDAMARRVEALERMRKRAQDLVDRDAEAYDSVTAAFKLPKTNDAEKAARTQAVQKALAGALAVPCATMELALDALRLCADGASDINPNLASDCATGGLCLASALESAFQNVRINAASLHDKQLARERLTLGETWRIEARALADSIRAAVDRKLS